MGHRSHPLFRRDLITIFKLYVCELHKLDFRDDLGIEGGPVLCLSSSSGSKLFIILKVNLQTVTLRGSNIKHSYQPLIEKFKPLDSFN